MCIFCVQFSELFLFFLFFAEHRSQSTLYDRLTRVLRSIPLNERRIAMIIFFFLLMILSCRCCLTYMNKSSVPVYTCEIFSMELISVVVVII